MLATDQPKTFALGDRSVKRLGYGAMQLAGPCLVRQRIMTPHWPCCARRLRPG
jgi:hypothetical protein